MDNIWDRNPSKLEVIGRCGGVEKTNDHAEPSNAIFFNKKMYFVPKYSILVSRRSINVTWLSWDL